MRGGEVSVGNALRLALTSIMRSRSDTRCGRVHTPGGLGTGLVFAFGNLPYWLLSQAPLCLTPARVQAIRRVVAVPDVSQDVIAAHVPSS